MKQNRSIALGTVMGGLGLVLLVGSFVVQMLRSGLNSHYADIPRRFNADYFDVFILLLIGLVFSGLGVLIELIRMAAVMAQRRVFTGNLAFPMVVVLAACVGLGSIHPPMSDHYAVDACINQMRNIDAAKQQWGLAHQKSAEAIPTEADLLPYIGRLTSNRFPQCPGGGVYHINALNQLPTCSYSLSQTNLPPGKWITHHVFPTVHRDVD